MTPGGTNAYRGQAGDRRGTDRGSRSASAMIVSEYRGLKVSEFGDDPSKPAQAERHVPRRQEPADADRSTGSRDRRPSNRCSRVPPLWRLPWATKGAAAKAVLEAFRPYRLIKVTGAVIGSKAIDAEGVTRLSTLPSRDVLRAQVAGAIAAPMATMAGLFDAPLRDVAGLVQALADQRGSSAA